MRTAIALSLGKSVDQLTAREALGLTAETKDVVQQFNKRKRHDDDDAEASNSNNKKTKDQRHFWDGVVKLTHVTGFTGPNFIRFEDIIEKDKLKKAVITAMVVSMDWIEEQFPSHVNLCVVLHGRPAMARQLSTTRTFIVPPLKDENWGVFHSKLMILVYENSMRIVIGSANLERYDYNDLENVVFIQDFPLASKATTSITHLPRFARDIAELLKQMHVPSSVQGELLKYDFSRAKAHVIASVSGDFQGRDQYRQYGHARLAQIIREIGAADPNRPPRIEMQTSSLGGLNASYLHELYRSFSGIDPYETSNKPVRMKNNEPLPPIDIIYPSMDTVLDSRLGPPGAGTICLNTSSWRKPTFPKQVMCDAISHRRRTLMHSKYIIATLPQSSEHRLKGWVYCGSHNATMGAWGKLSITRDSKQPKMSINNWELGVILPLYEDSDIPVTYVRPPPRYRPGQDAWTQE